MGISDYVLSFLFGNQLMLGVLVAQPFFASWHQRRSNFCLRFTLLNLVALTASIVFTSF